MTFEKLSGQYWRRDANEVSVDSFFPDDQKVQLYELMTEIRKRELEENDPEYKPQQ